MGEGLARNWILIDTEVKQREESRATPKFLLWVLVERRMGMGTGVRGTGSANGCSGG